MKTTGNGVPVDGLDDGLDDGLIESVEALLVSLTVVVSARLVLDPKKGPHVHVLVTAETPVSEVSRTVMSALVLGAGFEVRAGSMIRGPSSNRASRFLSISPRSHHPRAIERHGLIWLDG